jgi:hypothetical protein
MMMHCRVPAQDGKPPPNGAKSKTRHRARMPSHSATKKAALRRPFILSNSWSYQATAEIDALLRRKAAYPRPAKPTSSMAHVDGSGTTAENCVVPTPARTLSNSKEFADELTTTLSKKGSAPITT